MSISFFVPGLPATQGSKRHVGGGRMIDSCKRLPAWRSAVAYTAQQAHSGDPLTEAVELCVMFVLPRPKSHFGTGKNANVLKASAPRYPVGKPDLTKMLRAVEDAMKDIIWRDDSQVVRQQPEKTYCLQCSVPQCKHVGAHITVETMEQIEIEEAGRRG